MPLTLLKTIVQDACREVSLPQPLPNDPITTTDDPALQLMRRLVNAEGRSLLKRHAWAAYIKEHTFLTVPVARQGGSIPIDPDDFGRIMPETVWDRTLKKRIWGPLMPDEWAAMQSNYVASTTPCWRIFAGLMHLAPAPPAGNLYAYEYVSVAWRASMDGTVGTSWVNEDDVTALNEEAMTLGLIWRYRADKGFEFGDDLREYERCVADLIMNDGGRPRLSSSKVDRDRVPQAPLAPETIPGY